MKGETNKFLIEGDLVKIYLVGKYSDRVALTDLKSFLKYELFNHVWRCTKNGYVYTLVENKSLFLHRLITDNHGELHTDHIENTNDPIKDKLNNVRSNLRICTNRQNQMNSRRKKDNSTGYKGVHFTKGAYNVHTRFKGPKYFFGGYNVKKFGEEKSVVMAAAGYDIACEHLNGEFAQHNEIKASGLLTDEEMKIVTETTYKHIEKHGLLHNEKKIEAPTNLYARVNADEEVSV